MKAIQRVLCYIKHSPRLELEYRALSTTTYEVVWLSSLLTELIEHFERPPDIHMILNDSTSFPKP